MRVCVNALAGGGGSTDDGGDDGGGDNGGGGDGGGGRGNDEWGTVWAHTRSLTRVAPRRKVAQPQQERAQQPGRTHSRSR